jgi:hypothetical protein
LGLTEEIKFPCTSTHDAGYSIKLCASGKLHIDRLQ